MDICVESYSDTEYAQEPRSWVWEEKRRVVNRVLAEARSPEEKWFRVQADDGAMYTLTYRWKMDQWFVHSTERPASESKIRPGRTWPGINLVKIFCAWQHLVLAIPRRKKV